MPGRKTISWNKDTMDTILVARDKLVEMGMSRPSIRAVLYLLKDTVPGWEKRHYDTLTVKLGQWRDAGEIPFGLFSDDGGGSNYRPLLSREIAERIQNLKDAIPAHLAPDGYLYAIFIEHISLVDMIADFTDYQIPVVSSQGQLRREHLYTAVSGWMKVVNDLGGKGVKCYGLTDYDPAGVHIFESHQRWLQRIFKVKLVHWAITQEQLKAARLPVFESHQLDGWMAVYGPQKLKEEIRRLVRVG